jgi:uncharacterized protein with ParB-like and HNH nuclease domain
MDAGKRTINDIFNGNRILEIPFFQRSYVWGEEQWERLLDDMYDVCLTNKAYFLGSVILKQQPTTTTNKVGDRRIVIDGQQRLTTLNIFFKVLCLKTGQNNTFERIFKLLTNDIALCHNHNDIESFENIINLNTLDKISKQDNITGCYKYFNENMNISKLNINTILSKILFVGIDIDENEDEQQIFDTINSLGVKLTTAELLKNYFFSRDNISMYDSYWKNVFEFNDEIKEYWDTEVTTGRIKRTFIDLFLFAYLQIRIESKGINVKAEDKIEFSKVEQLFQSYKKFIKEYLNNDSINVLKEIKEYAIIFKDNFDANIVNDNLTADSGIERINALIFGLDNSTLIPYVLFVLKQNNSVNQRNELFEYLETYMVRRIIVKAINKNYNQLFSDRLILNDIKNKNDFISYINTQADKSNYMPNDNDLLNAFHNNVLVNKTTAGILYLIETKIRKINLHSSKVLGISKYSLEHLMPKKWENNWGKLNNQQDIDKRNKKILTFGNLAIITQNLNAKIRDADWNTKKNGTNNNGLIDYTRDLETISSYLKLSNWNETEIENRANDLYNYAINIWKIYT